MLYYARRVTAMLQRLTHNSSLKKSSDRETDTFTPYIQLTQQHLLFTIESQKLQQTVTCNSSNKHLYTTQIHGCLLG